MRLVVLLNCSEYEELDAIRKTCKYGRAAKQLFGKEAETAFQGSQRTLAWPYFHRTFNRGNSTLHRHTNHEVS